MGGVKRKEMLLLRPFSTFRVGGGEGGGEESLLFISGVPFLVRVWGWGGEGCV